MGQLTITAVKDNVVPTINKTASSELQSLPTVSAVVQVYHQKYLFTLSGALPQHLDIIPSIALSLEKIVAAQVNQYAAPQHMTFSGKGLVSTPVALTGSARALYNLLAEVLENQTSNIETLLINDQIKSYQAGYWINGGLEYLKDMFPKIQVIHLPHLMTLQVFVVPHSTNILLGLADLLKRGCLNQLKTLELPYSAKYQSENNASEMGVNDIETMLGLQAVYHAGFKNDKNFTALTQLRLTLWTELTTSCGLDTLSRLYARLKTLTIDAVMPNAKREDKLPQTVENGIVNYLSYYGGAAEVEKFILPKNDGLSALDALIQEQAEHSQLESLEIYHWHPGQPYPVFAHEKLQLYLANGWLPNLSSIKMRAAVDRPFLEAEQINPETAADTSGLLTTLIEKQTPIIQLQLLMPEKEGYQAWLNHLAAGGFPKLSHLSYRLPDRWLEEAEEAQHSRIGQALHAIHTAILEHRIPQLEACIIEGVIPSQLEYMVQQIDNLLLTRRLLQRMKRALEDKSFIV
jgi:hypothetical protein